MGDSLGWLSKLSQLVGGGGSKPRGDFWVDDSKVKNCYDCETAFSVFVRKHHCRVCGRIFCGNCTKNFLPAPDPSSGESWMRVCNYCYSARQKADPSLSLGLGAGASSAHGKDDADSRATRRQGAQPSGAAMSQKPAGGGAAPRGGGTAGAGAWQAPPPPLKDARVGSGAAAAGTPKALGVVASAGSGALPTETIALEVHRTALTMTARQHLQRLVSQLLEAEQVEWPEVWQPIIEELAIVAARSLSAPATLAFNKMSPNFYIKVKKVPGVGAPADSCAVQGVVCRRNVTHRRMRSLVGNPRVLLLGGSLEYQRVANKLSSFDALVDQEREHLRLAVSRVAALRPDVVLVEGSVARFAQDELLSRGVSLVINVRMELLERIARSLGTFVVPSFEQLQVQAARPGTCQQFRVEAVPLPAPAALASGAPSAAATTTGGTAAGDAPPPPAGTSSVLPAAVPSAAAAAAIAAGGGGGGPKTLMYFDGAPRPLGCTVLLKGDSLPQLARLKRVMQFAVHASYHLGLECAFLANQMAAALTAVAPELLDSGADVVRSVAQAAVRASADSAKSEQPGTIGLSVSPHVTASAVAPGEAVGLYSVHRLTRNASSGANLAAAGSSTSSGAGGGIRSSLSAAALADSVALPSSQRGSGSPTASAQAAATAYGADAISTSVALGRLPFTRIDDSSLLSQGGGSGAADLEQQQQQQQQPGDSRRASKDSVAEAAASTSGAQSSQPRQQQQLVGGVSSGGGGGGQELYRYQRIFVSMACFNPRKAMLCEPPSIKRLDFYSDNDLPLISFLLAMAPHPSKRCMAAGCGEGVCAHERTFMHGDARLTLSVGQLSAAEELPGEAHQQVWTWLRLREGAAAASSTAGSGTGGGGGQNTPPSMSPSARRLPLPPEAACVSLGQLLQLSFSGQHLEVVGHNVHSDFVRYYGLGRSVLAISRDKVATYSFETPGRLVRYGMASQLVCLKSEAAELCMEAMDALDAIDAALHEHPQFMSQRMMMAAVDAFSARDDPDSPTGSGGGGRSLSGTTIAAGVPPSLQALLSAAKRDRSAIMERISAAVVRLEEEVQAAVDADSATAAPSSPRWQQEGSAEAGSRSSGGSSSSSSNDGWRPAAPWQKGLIRAMMELNTLRRSLTLTQLFWAALLHDPVAFAQSLAKGAVHGKLRAADAGSSDSLFGQDGAPPPAHPGAPMVQSSSGTQGPVSPAAVAAFLTDMHRNMRRELLDGSVALADAMCGQPRPRQPRDASFGASGVSGRADSGSGDTSSAQPSASDPSSARGAATAAAAAAAAAAGAAADRLAATRPGGAPPAGAGRSLFGGDDPFDANLSDEEEGMGGEGIMEGARIIKGGDVEDEEQQGRRREDGEEGDGSASEQGSGGADQADVGYSTAEQMGGWLSADGKDVGSGGGGSGSFGAGSLQGAGGGGAAHGSSRHRRMPSAASQGSLGSAGSLGAPSTATASTGPAAGAGAASKTAGYDGDEAVATAAMRASAGAAARGDGRGGGGHKSLGHLLTNQLAGAGGGAAGGGGGSGGGKPEAPIMRLSLASRALMVAGIQGVIIPIYDNEPSSVLSHFLSERAYHHMLSAATKAILRAQQQQQQQQGVPAASAGIAPPGSSGGSSSSSQRLAPAGSGSIPSAAGASSAPTGSGSGGGSSSDAGAATIDWLSVLLCKEAYHFRHSFEDDSPGMLWARTRFQVVAYYAPQFAELRRQVVQGGEAAFITSLCRCRKWEARGGKSQAYFAKTRDDRFVLKGMSKTEKASFLEFAPAYFEHLARSLVPSAGGRPTTAVAKVVGVFSITAKGAAAGAAGGSLFRDGSLDVLVMENVFYDRQISRIYDLKGSERSRFNAEAAAHPNDPKVVHMDDNLRSAVNVEGPIMVADPSLRETERLLWADTSFLSGLGVMDYSLLVGVDRGSGVLVAAVIDFIRQYTWDKQLETWVKSSGILGGGGKDPTIISPKQYARRFNTAMATFFALMPALDDVAPPAGAAPAVGDAPAAEAVQQQQPPPPPQTPNL